MDEWMGELVVGRCLDGLVEILEWVDGCVNVWNVWWAIWSCMGG